MPLPEPILSGVRSVIGEDVYGRIRKQLRTGRQDSFLRETTGVIHVGANIGQEREIYDDFELDVVWVEPISNIFDQLSSNISTFPKQRAYQYLVTDEDERTYNFHVANNNGEASSILDLSRHSEMWPQVSYCGIEKLRSITLSSLVRREQIDIRRYQALILDTQGAELMVLKGASDLLPHFRFVKVEAADFESYKSGCTADEITGFLEPHGFEERTRSAFKSLKGVGTYFDILYQRG